MSKQLEKFLVWWAPFKPQDTNRLDRVAFAAWQAALAAQAQEAPSGLGILAAPNTLGGFASSNHREPTAQEIFDAGVRSGMQRSPAPASAQAVAMNGFYLASFKRPNGFVTWWRPDNAGYTPYLGQAGIYTREQLETGYHDSDDTVPVPVAFVGQFEQRVVDRGMTVCGKVFWSAKNLREAIDAHAAAPSTQQGAGE